MDNSTDSLNRRLNHLETQVAGIASEVDGLKQGFERLVSAVDTLATRMGEKSQTHWPTVISALSFVTIVGGLSLAPIYSQLDDFKGSQTRQWQTIRSHMAEAGHAPMLMRADALQTKMDLKDENVLERLSALRERVVRIEDEQKRRTSKVYGPTPNSGGF